MQYQATNLNSKYIPAGSFLTEVKYFNKLYMALGDCYAARQDLEELLEAAYVAGKQQGLLTKH